MLFLLQNQEALSHILEALYEAPLDPSRWEEFVCLTAETAGAFRYLFQDLKIPWSICFAPTCVPIISRQFLCDLDGPGAKILFIHDSVFIHHEGHHSR